MSRPAPVIARLTITVLVFIAAWSPVDALDAVDAVVPESASLFDHVQTLFDPHAEAVAKYQLLQAQGKSDNACIDLAQATINDVTKQVSDHQKIMNNLSDGSECAAKGQAKVTAAKNDLDTKQAIQQGSATELSNAQSAPVDFPSFALDTLQVGQCGQFYDSTQYTTAKQRRTKAEAAKVQADADVGAAQTVHDNAVAEAAELKQQCLCAAKKAHDTASKLVQDMVEDNKKAWTKAYHLKCVVAGTAPAKCSVPDTPTVSDKVLVGEAVSAQCNEATDAPTDPPSETPIETHSVNKYGNGNSWASSQQVCSSTGKQLCTFEQICPNGEGSVPVDGGSSASHAWSAMRRADGATNDWVHISGLKHGSGHTYCKPHDKYLGFPAWGTSNNQYNHKVYCCPGAQTNAP